MLEQHPAHHRRKHLPEGERPIGYRESGPGARDEPAEEQQDIGGGRGKDREPVSCTYEQLERPVRFDVDQVLAGRPEARPETPA